MFPLLRHFFDVKFSKLPYSKLSTNPGLVVIVDIFKVDTKILLYLDKKNELSFKVKIED